MMNKAINLSHEFMKNIPDSLEDGVIYISIPYATVVHVCCCGCKNEVVTPLSPIDWNLTYNGETVSLYPSIGNWNFECQSHYWIKNNNVEWAKKWTHNQIKYSRKQDSLSKKDFYKDRAGDIENVTEKKATWNKLKRWFS